jgi:hypothetical protein
MSATIVAMKGRAGFSRCGRYRYWLRRSWDRTLPQCAFVGLNPSTANAKTNDPTLRRCIDFAQQWGFGSLLMVNLFSLRATDPRELLGEYDPIGPRTNLWLRRARGESQLIIAAWGNGGALQNRHSIAAKLLGNMRCLGVTATGMPKHPLYCPKTTPLLPFTLGPQAVGLLKP